MAVNKGSAKDVILDPPCAYCRNLQHMGTQDLKGWTCSAFPEEIPYLILARLDSHVELHPFQDGPGKFDSKVYEFEGVPHKITFEGDWHELKGSR